MIYRVTACFLSLLIVLPLFGQDRGEERQKELDALKRSISMLQEQLKASRAKKRTVEQELKEVKIKKSILEQEMRSMGLQIQQKENQLQTLESNLEDLSGKVEKERGYLLAKMRFLNRMGSLGYLRLLFLSRDGGDMLSAFRWIVHLARQDRALIEAYMDNMVSLKEQQELAKQLHGTLQEYRHDRKKKENQLGQAISQHRYLLTKIRRQERETQEQVTRLEEKATRLERLLTILASVAANRDAREDIHGYKGVLDWPLKGTVTSRFGTSVNPEYGTTVRKRGIQMRVAGTSDVSPIFPGRVIYARWFKGYRNLVIVDHGFGVVSIYGYLDSIGVKKGDWVYPGKMVGKVIAGGNTETKLYLEIRDQGTSVDPLAWLR